MDQHCSLDRFCAICYDICCRKTLTKRPCGVCTRKYNEEMEIFFWNGITSIDCCVFWCTMIFWCKRVIVMLQNGELSLMAEGDIFDDHPCRKNIFWILLWFIEAMVHQLKGNSMPPPTGFTIISSDKIFPEFVRNKKRGSTRNNNSNEPSPFFSHSLSAIPPDLVCIGWKQWH